MSRFKGRGEMAKKMREEKKKEQKMEKVYSIVKGANLSSGPIKTPMHKSKVKSAAKKAFGGSY